MIDTWKPKQIKRKLLTLKKSQLTQKGNKNSILWDLVEKLSAKLSDTTKFRQEWNQVRVHVFVHVCLSLGLTV